MKINFCEIKELKVEGEWKVIRLIARIKQGRKQNRSEFNDGRNAFLWGRAVRSTFAVRETASLGIMGAPRVPPLNPSESIVL